MKTTDYLIVAAIALGVLWAANNVSFVNNLVRPRTSA